MRPTLKQVRELRPLARPHKNAAYQELLEDIRKRGVIVPLVITGDGLVVKGCRRLEALKEARGPESYVPVNVLDDDLTQEELWDLRARLTVLSRNPSPREIKRFAGLKSPDPPTQKTDDLPCNPEVEPLIEEILAAKGFGPRILSLIAKQITVVIPEPEQQDDSLWANLADLLGPNGATR